MASQEGIPTIDLGACRHGAPAARRAAVEALGEGLSRFGFVTVEGHGVDAALVRRAYEGFARFFALPDAVKRRYAGVDEGGRAYTPFGVEHAKDSPHPDLKEFWHVGQELPAGHPYRRVYADNVWPEEVPELAADALALYRALERCAETLLGALGEFFGLPPATFPEMMRDGNTILRAIHYPPVGACALPGSVRAAAHEDINLVTLLCEATDAGLEILTREGWWLPVAARPGEIVVDAGDMLSRVTNEVIPATTHRVVNPPAGADRDRYSMPFFVHPWPACDLTVMERFVSPERPARFPPTTAGRFLEERLRAIGMKT